jgi:iron complex transport system ATP-binding protein
MNSSVLTAQNLTIGYVHSRSDQTVIAQGLNLELDTQDLVCLVGPNGVGKSTLLRTLTGLQPKLGGILVLKDKPLEKYTSRALAQLVSVVLTAPVQVGNMKVRNLVGLGRFPFTGLFDSRNPEDDTAVQAALEMAGAEDLEERFVHELSDGERQRVMIARALAQEPLLLVLDEPTAFLDLPGRVATMQLMRELAHTHGKAVLASTHDLDQAIHLADKMWLMGRDGAVLQGAPEDLVLSGAFGTTFAQPNLQFDLESGSFEAKLKPEQRVVLQAEGLADVWTARALRRAGFEVLVDGPSDLQRVEVVQHNARTTWRLLRFGVALEFDSIYALLLGLSG